MSETYRTTPDRDGGSLVLSWSPFGEPDTLLVEWPQDGMVEVPPMDRAALVAFILGWPVDQVARVDPATHVVVERADLRVVTRPEYVSDATFERSDAALRAALGEDGAW